MTRSEYDRSVNSFSPEGRLFQVEYAIEAIKLGSTAIGIQTKEGCILAVEKRITSPLIVTSSIEKVFEVDKHVGCAMSGLIADARTLIERARVEAQNHWFTYNESMKVESITSSVSSLALAFGEGSTEKAQMSRPFGVALLFAGVDKKWTKFIFVGSIWNICEMRCKSNRKRRRGSTRFTWRCLPLRYYTQRCNQTRSYYS